MILSDGTGTADKTKGKLTRPRKSQIGRWARKEDSVHRRLINETAFSMTRNLLGVIAPEADDEEHRRLFERVFNACTAGLMAYCRQVQRMQHQLRPLGGSNATAATQ